jgi:hypothetical protein
VDEGDHIIDDTGPENAAGSSTTFSISSDSVERIVMLGGLSVAIRRPFGLALQYADAGS